MKAVKDAGGRALPLKVSGAFHSPYMTSASEAFGELLINKDVGTPSGILYSNMTGDVYPDNIRETLAGQICSPVRWENIIRSMIRKGADTFIEAGPGSVLSERSSDCLESEKQIQQPLLLFQRQAANHS